MTQLVMAHKLQVTDKTRLLAAGLMSLVTLLELPCVAQFKRFATPDYALVICAVFATGAFVFSLAPLYRGSPAQKLLAVLFLFPPFFFFLTAFSRLTE